MTETQIRSITEDIIQILLKKMLIMAEQALIWV